MRIAVAQIESVAGNLQTNVARHLEALEVLAPDGAELVVFPELSLTAYEPDLAGAAAIASDDSRLAPLAAFANRNGITVCAGAPLVTADKPEIAAILFVPGEPRRVIRKACLHVDEEPFFASGSGQAIVLDLAQRIGVAICHDINVDAHIKEAAAQGMEIYLAGVAKTADGIAAARQRLTVKAQEFRVPILVVNCSGYCEGKPAGGGSFIVDAEGTLLAELGRDEQALLIYDTADNAIEKRQLPP